MTRALIQFSLVANAAPIGEELRVQRLAFKLAGLLQLRPDLVHLADISGRGEKTPFRPAANAVTWVGEALIRRVLTRSESIL